MMASFCPKAIVSLLVILLLSSELSGAKKGSSSSSSSSKKTSSSSSKSTKTKPSSQPANYPRQPQSPNRNPNPYPPGGSYPHPGTGNANPGGYPRQNPASYPAAGSNPNQYPGRVNPGSYPNQNPAGGYPAAGGNPAAGGYPNQNPAGGYPAAGRYPNQYPAAGGNPAAGGYPNQYPAAGGYPNQNPGRNYPNQYPAAGGYPNQYPAAGGYPNQRGGYPNQYPAAGGYPVSGGNTRQGWGANPGSYPGGGFGGYPNWNPNNKILSPRYGGGGYGHGGYGMGGSPFSNSVQRMGYQPKSSGFAKKAMMAAGVGAVAGMAVGYGLGRFPRPHFNFHNPQEEYYYNNYMYKQYGSKSTDQVNYGDYVYKPPPRAETYEAFMARCMNSTDVKDKGSSSSTPTTGGEAEDDDTVSIEEIGYPALIDQVKNRRCIELYMVYSAKFLERKAEPQVQPNHSNPLSSGVIQFFTSSFVLLFSMFLLQ